MNDPVIERVRGEDPAVGAGGNDAHADVVLARVRAEIDAEIDPRTAVMSTRRLRRLRAPLGVPAVVTVVVVGAIVVIGGRHQRVTGRLGQPGPMSRLDVVSAGSVRVGAGPVALLAADGSLWVAGQGYVARLDPVTGSSRHGSPCRGASPAPRSSRSQQGASGPRIRVDPDCCGSIRRAIGSSLRSRSAVCPATAVSRRPMG